MTKERESLTAELDSLGGELVAGQRAVDDATQQLSAVKSSVQTLQGQVTLRREELHKVGLFLF